jgi:hypothetical protein
VHRLGESENEEVKRVASERTRRARFKEVAAVGLKLPGVEAATKYDGSPVLKVGGSFMAGLATHCSAESDTLVLRSGLEERECLIQDAPDTYYLTDYYRKYPLVLVRLSRITHDALGDLLRVSWKLTLEKTRQPQRLVYNDPSQSEKTRNYMR